jgi:NAD(P)-dependent dehydrogenase (short-subunit alcohol dehydrogenase family)
MKNIVITGAGRGIGKETLLKMAQLEPVKILAISRSAEQLELLQSQISKGSELHIYPFDLGSDDFLPLQEWLHQHTVRIDILINNAGYLVAKPFAGLTSDDFDILFRVNVRGIFKMCQICLPLMNHGGHIVNISSMGGFQGSVKFPGLSLYSASKGAVSVFTESLAAELQEQGIAVNALAFGAVDTDMLRAAFPQYKAPLSASEMGEFVADFAMNGGKFFNGKVLPVSSSTP